MDTTEMKGEAPVCRVLSFKAVLRGLALKVQAALSAKTATIRTDRDVQSAGKTSKAVASAKVLLSAPSARARS